jgi:predicted PurR-regulated permease PerM
MTDRRPAETLILKALLAGLALWLFYSNLTYALDALIALMIAAAILPLAEAAQKRRIPRVVTVLGVYILGIGGLALLIALLVPVVADQGRQIARTLPAYRERLTVFVGEIGRFLSRHGGREQLALPDLGLSDIGSLVQQLAERSLQATRGVLSGAVSAVLVLFVAAYIVADSRRLADGLLVLVPPARRGEVVRIGTIVMERMGGYVFGQLAVSLCIATILSIGLAVLGIEAPVLIGVTAGALNFVPFLGSTVGFLLALLGALNTGAFAVGGVLILFGAVQTVEGKLLVPYFLGRKVKLHPLAVLAALLVGLHLAGLIGAVVAVPILAGLNAVLQETYVKNLR